MECPPSLKKLDGMFPMTLEEFLVVIIRLKKNQSKIINYFLKHIHQYDQWFLERTNKFRPI